MLHSKRWPCSLAVAAKAKAARGTNCTKGPSAPYGAGFIPICLSTSTWVAFACPCLTATEHLRTAFTAAPISSQCQDRILQS